MAKKFKVKQINKDTMEPKGIQYLDPLVVFANLDAAITSDDKLNEYNMLAESDYFCEVEHNDLFNILCNYKVAKVVYISFDGTSIVSVIDKGININDPDLITIPMEGSTLNIRTRNIEQVLYSEPSSMVLIKNLASYILIYDDGTKTFI